MNADFSTPGATILLAGGGRDQDAVARQLKQIGYSVVCIDSGKTTLDAVEKYAVDMVLLDARSPTSDAADSLETIRQRHTALELPVIVLGPGTHDAEDIVATLDLGANDCVTEPVNSPLHLARISAQVSLKRTMESLRQAHRDLERQFAERTAELQMLNDKLKTEIDERKRVEQGLERASKMEAVGHLAGGIAHEINTPVQYIGDNLRFLSESFEDVQGVLDEFRAFAETARKAGGLAEELTRIDDAVESADLEYHQEEVPQAIRQSLPGVEQISSIVLAMKEFSHPNTKEKTATDIDRVIENAFAVCRNEWKHVAEMELDLESAMPPVVCIPGELSQVFLNLIVNAAHAIEGLGDKEMGRISVSTRRHDGRLEIRVADTGGGVPDSIRKNIFDPFFTTKEVGKGTGQGLAIVHNIVVNTHGGELTFESEPGKGTTFVIRLPLEDCSELLEAAQ
jgi:signal transduction histidine kinase